MTATAPSVRAEVTSKRGNEIKGRWGQWYRHDTLVRDGKELEGFVQVRRRYYGRRPGHRIEAITCFRGACVIGRDHAWLIAQNDAPNPQFDTPNA